MALGQVGTNLADAAVAPELITKDQLVEKYAGYRSLKWYGGFRNQL
jgi:hypothetical protein